MARLNGIEISYKTRLCKVGNEIGDFLCWEQYANVVGPGLAAGSHNGGQLAQVYGIVEFADGVRRVDPSNIKFIDEDHQMINELNKDSNKFHLVKDNI